MEFTAKNFFDLTFFQYPSLFQDDENVWEVLKRLHDFLIAQTKSFHEATIDPRAILINPSEISIGRGSVVEAGAYIKGPCIIGEECEVRSGAYIRGDFLAGDRCVIGHGTEIKNTIFLDQAHAGHFAYIGDSILGNRVNLGAGTKCANLRLDRKNISISHEEARIETGLRKMGAIFGDEAQTGCNCVTNPGTLMAKRSLAYPCVNVSGVVPENHVIKGIGRLSPVPI
jgi:UDP-N-acetylglucosamine diphosphorylase / glucose-1-phosphate thymidylyltransferase / UDP-N-acetylgalactosamine diphosphorylase / glucosamine-1-phosphate N-acetyltransferase / galactosamine-1-phosphate N-acetyltransferase